MSDQRNIRVLIAEDDYMVGEMIKGLLEEAGYTLAGHAASGLAAVEMAQSLQPDVILMDIKMPDLSGVEATQCIHESCPTPVVMLTAYETPELVEQASTAGAGAYLVKPSNAREVERAITIAMARFRDMMELHQLNAELQARNEELGAFAHTVAHDIKNPLALIMGFAETLKENCTTMPEEELQNYLQIIARSAHKVSDITDALLLLAEARMTDVLTEPLDMTRIVAEAQQRLAYEIEKHQAEVILPETWPLALGYAPWVEGVWVNYISNGIKYGGQPPRVELGATVQADGNVRFWVRDNGAGIPPEKQTRLFTPFTQLDESRAEGQGLGLSIARRIVEKLGGQVGVESKVGQGSTFSFTLPAKQRPQ